MASFISTLLGRPTVPEATGERQAEARSPAPAANVAVSVKGLTKRYRDLTVLDRVTFSVTKGASLGIVGLNGAGKSTLLQLIAGTLEPSEGEVKVAGRVVALLELGAGFNDDFTGIENVYLNASILGIPRGVIERRLPEIEAFAEIGDFIRKPVRTYSSGMRVRLAFSLLTQVNPDVMIIDEALAVGDAYFAHKCSRVIRRFREEGRTLLFVSHDPSAVRTFCSRALLLDRGSIIKEGTPVAVLDYYNAMIASRERLNEARLQRKEGGQRLNRSGNLRAKIESFEMLDSDDRSVRIVGTGSRVRVACVVAFNDDMENPTVGFLIRDRLGNDVFGTNTLHLDRPTGSFRKGERAEVNFPTTINLGPGTYTLTLAVHLGADHTDENFDWCDHVLAFSVIPAWPFTFVGVAALPTQVEISRTVTRLRRTCRLGEPITFGEDGNAHLYQGDGWSFPEAGFSWTDGPRCELLFELPQTSSDFVLELDASPFLAPGLLDQKVELLVNGEARAHLRISEPGVHQCRLPAAALGGQVHLTLVLPDCASPASTGSPGDERLLGLAVRSLTWKSPDA